MTSEWLKVMLEEIARKRDDASRAREEMESRRRAGEPLPPDAAAGPTPAAGTARAV